MGRTLAAGPTRRRGGRPERRHFIIGSIALCVTAISLTACTDDEPETPTALDVAFYNDAARFDLANADRGELLDQQVTVAPEGLTAIRFLYRSIDATGQPAAVSGVAFRPTSAPPRGGFPLIAFAHPTTGLADSCAPSRRSDGLSITADMVKAGYAVVQTDYVGLGTPGVHPYMHGPSEAAAVLDSITAGRAMTSLSASSSQVALWGYSQGGHAVLFAGQDPLAQAMGIVGIVDAAGPSSRSWAIGAEPGPGINYQFAMMLQTSWAATLGLDLSLVALPKIVALSPQLIDDANPRCPDANALVSSVPPKERQRLSMADVPPWSSALAAMDMPTTGSVAPVFIQHGTADEVVPFAQSVEAATILCAAGTIVQLKALEKGTHGLAALPGLGLDWLAGRFAGEPAPNSCPAK